MGQIRWVSTGTIRKSTARARHHSASVGTRHGLYSAWAAGQTRSTSTGTTRLMGRHDAGPITPTEMAQFANLGIKSTSFFLPTGHSPHRHPSAAAPSRNSRSVPPSTSRRLYPLLRAPLSRPLAPRRRPAAAPPSRTAPPARCRASLSRRTRPHPAASVAACPHLPGQRPPPPLPRRPPPAWRAGVPNGTARHAGALAGPCLGRDGGTAALRGTARRSRRARACRAPACPCRPCSGRSRAVRPGWPPILPIQH